MAAVQHVFQSAVADGADTTLILPSDFSASNSAGFASHIVGDVLTNQSGVSLSVGDVAVIDGGHNSAVILDDTSASQRTFVVCLGSISGRTMTATIAGATGFFANFGTINTLCTGAITRGNYVRKSATTKALEDAGVSATGTSIAPLGALGMALQGQASGTAVLPVLWFGGPRPVGFPSTFNQGDIPYAAAAGGTLSSLAIGAAGKIIQAGATVPGYTAYTVPTSVATGDIWRGSATNTLAALAAGTQGHVLQMGASLPAWSLPFFHGRCRVTKSGANLKLSPYDGNTIIINSQVQTIPDAGVTLAITTEAASTTYYIYAFMNGATMTLESSTTTHATQAGTGVEIKSGDATRTLVGLARTTAGTAWADTATQRFVISWFNRRGLALVNNFTANRTTTSTTYVELNTEIRNEFVTWGDERVEVSVNGPVSDTVASAGTVTSIGFDGTNQENAMCNMNNGTANNLNPIGLTAQKSGLSEGYHYVTVLGAVGSGTGTWSGGTYTADTTHRDIVSLHALVRG